MWGDDNNNNNFISICLAVTFFVCLFVCVCLYLFYFHALSTGWGAGNSRGEGRLSPCWPVEGKNTWLCLIWNLHLNLSWQQLLLLLQRCKFCFSLFLGSMNRHARANDCLSIRSVGARRPPGEFNDLCFLIRFPFTDVSNFTFSSSSITFNYSLFVCLFTRWFVRFSHPLNME